MAMDGWTFISFRTAVLAPVPSTGLYQQMDDGRLKDVSKGSGLDFAGYNMGVAVGDVNNDGRPDVVVTQYGGVRLFVNNGDGKFGDITRESGLDNPHWGTSAAFFDYDRDGWLDLVLVNYLDYTPSRRCGATGGQPDFCNPSQFAGTVTRLFHNRGLAAGGKANAIRFEDATASSGLAAANRVWSGGRVRGFHRRWLAGHLHYQRRPSQSSLGQSPGRHLPRRSDRARPGLRWHGQRPANMGIGLGDVDGDGLFDVFVTHLASETHGLWHQGPRGLFLDRAADAGLAASDYRGTGFGTILEDFDGDGALDAAIVNGRIVRPMTSPAASLDRFWEPYMERNHLLAGDGAGHFRNISAGNSAFWGSAGVFRGLAAAMWMAMALRICS